jgi:hypothetical protein
MESSDISADDSESVGVASEGSTEVQLVLGLQAPLVNFGVEEI